MTGAGGDSRPAESATHAFFLETSPEPIFAVLHATRARPAATGVVICPLFGWEDLCTHRARRAWAKVIADAGYPAMRLDLPGTGDSGGTPRPSGQLARWTDALSAAADWLRTGQECSRICCIGIGFGGMLAWLAAAGGAGIDDFILWGVPIRGRRLMREVRAAAMLSIDRKIDRSRVPEAQLSYLDDEGLLLDEAGQVTTEETIGSLGNVDLLATPLPDPEGRRVLLLQRDCVSDDEKLAAYVRSLGAAVTVVSDGGGYSGLMQYVQQAAISDEVIATSLDWLAHSPDLTTHPGRRAPFLVPQARASVEMLAGGLAIRETAVTFDLPSGTLCGVLTEPVDAPAVPVSAAFFSGGSDRRIGPNRMWVTVARQWAAKGVASVRLDPPGVGDADGDERAWDQTRRHYDDRHLDLVSELFDEMVARGLPERFVLVGFCSGAFRSIHAASRDSRVVAVFGIGLMLFKWTWWTHNIRDSWLPDWTPKPGDSLLKIRVAAVLKVGVKIARRMLHQSVRLMQLFPNRADRVLRQLSGQGTRVVLMLKRSSFAYEQVVLPRRRERLEGLAGINISALAGDDQRFRPLVLQRAVESTMDEALAELVDLSAAPPAQGHVAIELTR